MDELSFGQWVQRRRRSLLLTQAQLADHVAYSTAAIRKIEADERRPSPDVAARMARALCISPDEQAQFLRFARGVSRRPPSAGASAYAVLDSRIEGGIPSSMTSLIGRVREQDELVALLNDPDIRMVTLTGPGGTGKTRLALVVAERLQGAYPDGVIVVSLAPVQDSAQVLPTIAGAFHISAPTREVLEERLVAVARSKRLLLVLDNLEHVLAAAKDVADLVRRAPTLKVLVTSRERLRITGEQVYPVLPLPLPDMHSEQTAAVLAHNDAITLFLERARAARRDFAWTDTAAPTVAAICCQLDGLPLAIELAAAFMAMLSPETLAASMERRLALLTAGPRDAPARQQTLRATIDWSYQLLTPDEQRWFARLAGLVSPWSLEAAVEVCAFDVADRGSGLLILRALVEKNLIRPAGTFGNQPFFAMLETIREYGLEQMEARGEREVLATRHTGYYTALAKRAEVGLHGLEQPEWYHRSLADMPNIFLALHGHVEQRNLGDALCIIGGFGFAWTTTQHDGAFYELLKGVVLLADGDCSFAYLGRALSWASSATSVPNRETALRHALDAVTLLRSRGDDWGIAFALERLALAYSWLHQYDKAEALYRESIALFETIGFRPGISRGLAELAGLMGDNGAPESEMRALLEQCAQIARIDGSIREVARVEFVYGRIEIYHGRYASAAEHFENALVHYEHLQSPRNLGLTYVFLAYAYCYLHRFTRAQRSIEHAVSYWRPLGLTPHYVSSITDLHALLARMQGNTVVSIQRYLEELRSLRDPDHDASTYRGEQLLVLRGIGCAAVDLGLFTDAALIFSATEVNQADLSAQPFDAADVAKHIALVQAQFKRADIRSAWEEGARMSLDAAIRYVFDRWSPLDGSALEPTNSSAA